MRARLRAAALNSEWSIAAHPAPGRYAVVNGAVCHLCAARPVASPPGSVFSLDHFLEYLLVHGQISDRPLEPGILRCQFFQAFGLVDPQATVFLAPAVESLLTNTKMFNRLSNGLALPLQDLGFAQFADNCIGGVSFLRHVPVLLSVKILT